MLGAGVAGANAVAIAAGMRARLTVLDVDVDKLRVIDEQYAGAVRTEYSTRLAVDEAVRHADLVIGAVLVPGAKAPTLVPNELVARMRPGAVLVDIAIDQGGCFETSRPTTHEDPVFEIDGVIHYCVANMPGAVARTSAFALNNATLPFVLKLAGQGAEAAMKADPHLANGLNVSAGKIRHQAVAEALGLPFEAA